QVRVGRAPTASPNVPSPLMSHEYVSVSPSASVALALRLRPWPSLMVNGPPTMLTIGATLPMLMVNCVGEKLVTPVPIAAGNDALVRSAVKAPVLASNWLIEPDVPGLPVGKPRNVGGYVGPRFAVNRWPSAVNRASEGNWNSRLLEGVVNTV